MYLDKSNELKVAGTAFLVFQDEEVFPRPAFFVTAKHVINGIKSNSIDETVYMRVNDRNGRAAKTSSPVSDWFGAQDPTINAACLYWPKSRDADLKLNMIPLSISANKDVIKQNNIGIGDETFVIGLFSAHIGTEINEPIARIGNIASFPREPITSQIGDVNGYLIESRSAGGLSGSPVYVHLQTKVREDGTSQICFPYFLLLGIMHGHFDVHLQTNTNGIQMINSGIGIVIPIDEILHIIDEQGDKFRLLDAQDSKDLFVRCARVRNTNSDKMSDDEWRQCADYIERIGIHEYIDLFRGYSIKYASKDEADKDVDRQKAKSILSEVLGIS